MIARVAGMSLLAAIAAASPPAPAASDGIG